MLYTTKIEKALQIITDSGVALAKIDDEFVRRNSLRDVGIKDITPNVI